MKIDIECPECNAKILIDLSTKTQEIKCPKCGNNINVNIDDKDKSIDKLDSLTDIIDNLGN